MKKLILCFAALAATLAPAQGAIITVTTPSPVVSGQFDVTVQATSLFAGRDPVTDGIISYGFNVSVSNPAVLTFLGATSGPLFDAPTTEPGTGVFGAASGFGIFSPVTEPLLLATLHFGVLGSGASNIVVTSDLTNAFQGLQFLNAPLQESIAGRLSITALTAVPEPATFALAGAALAALVLRQHHR